MLGKLHCTRCSIWSSTAGRWFGPCRSPNRWARIKLKLLLNHLLSGFIHKTSLQLHQTVQCQIEIKKQSTASLYGAGLWFVLRWAETLFWVPADQKKTLLIEWKKHISTYCFIDRQIFKCTAQLEGLLAFTMHVLVSHVLRRTFSFCVTWLNLRDFGDWLLWKRRKKLCNYSIQLVQYKCNVWDTLLVFFNPEMISSTHTH